MTEQKAKSSEELKGKTGPKRLINATRYSKQGFASAWKTEEAFRQEVILAIIMIPIACLLSVTMLEKLLLICSVFIVLIVEVLNSAIEAVVDRFGTEIHPLSGKAKDLGSLAVLLALIQCAVVWVTVIYSNYLAGKF